MFIVICLPEKKLETRFAFNAMFTESKNGKNSDHKGIHENIYYRIDKIAYILRAANSGFEPVVSPKLPHDTSYPFSYPYYKLGHAKGKVVQELQT